jgi:acyl-coenzyme A thioesterase PaaI-like protein
MSTIQHLRAHIAFRLEEVEGGAPAGYLPLGPRSRHRDGSVSLGAVATMVDVVGMRAGVHESGRGGPSVTGHLALRMPGPVDGTVLRATGRLIRMGRAGAVSLTHVFDETGAVVGVSTVDSAALASEGGSHTRSSTRVDDFFTRWPDPVDGPGPDDFMLLEAVGPHGDRLVYRMPFFEPLRNINGVMHGGGVCLIIEHAARQAGLDIGLSAPTFDSLDVHFLKPALVGPFRVMVEAVATGGNRRAFAVEVTDEGREDRRIALGLVTGGN